MTDNTTASWTTLGHTPPAALAPARLQAHHAAQWAARVARSYLDPVPDDSHTALSWDPAVGALVTGGLAGQGGPVRLGLRLADLTLSLWEADGTAAVTLPLDGRTDADVLAFLKAALTTLGHDPERLALDLPYDLPDHPVVSGAAYDVQGHGDGLEELARYFANAVILLNDVARQPGASPVRCWPHHFDIAVLIAIDQGGDPETDRSIGVGLSPGDETYAEPYLYVTPWPYPEAAALSGLTAGGQWHTQGFVAAIATASGVMLGEAGEARTRGFVDEAIAACRTVLGAA